MEPEPWSNHSEAHPTTGFSNTETNKFPSFLNPFELDFLRYLQLKAF